MTSSLRPFVTAARLRATKLVLAVEFRTFQPFQHISDVKCGLLHGAFDEIFWVGVMERGSNRPAGGIDPEISATLIFFMKP